MSIQRSASLSVANRQRVEIAKALSQNARVVVMDEPTASLAEADVQQLMAIVRGLRARGVGIVYVTHKLAEVFALADRVTVLRDGKHVGTRADRRSEREVAGEHDGRPLDRSALSAKPRPRSASPCSNCAMSVTAAWFATSPSHCGPGEILGIAGLVGSGRTELALTIFGLTPASSGEILVDGKARHHRQPRTGARSRHRLCSGGSRTAGPDPAADDCGKHRADRAQEAARAGSSSTRRKEDLLARDFISRLGIRARGAGTNGAAIVGRQSAESGACQMARRRAAHSHHGRADARHRCRRQGGNPCADVASSPRTGLPF